MRKPKTKNYVKWKYLYVTHCIRWLYCAKRSICQSLPKFVKTIMLQSHSMLFIVLHFFDFILDFFKFNWKRRRKTFAHNSRHLVSKLSQSWIPVYQMSLWTFKYHRIHLKPGLVWEATETERHRRMYDNRMLASYLFKCGYWNGQKVSHSSWMQFAILYSELVRLIEFVSPPLYCQFIPAGIKSVCC